MHRYAIKNSEVDKLLEQEWLKGLVSGLVLGVLLTSVFCLLSMKVF